MIHDSIEVHGFDNHCYSIALSSCEIDPHYDLGRLSNAE
jgi:hypothetical protein